MIKQLCPPCEVPIERVLVDTLPDTLCPCPEPEERPSLLETVRSETIVTDTYLEKLEMVLRTHNCEYVPVKTNLYKPPLISGKLPRARFDVAYAFTYMVVNGEPPFMFTITQGELPPGLTLDPDTGKIEGVPGEVGRRDFAIMVRDTRGRSNSMYSFIEIDP